MRLIFTVLMISVAGLATTLIAQDSSAVQSSETVISHGYRFVDNNGDGYNDNAPDHDGDGIPNGLDSDYHGRKFRGGKHKRPNTGLAVRRTGSSKINNCCQRENCPCYRAQLKNEKANDKEKQP